MPKPSIRRIIMAKEIAKRWLEKEAHAEYRLSVYHDRSKNIASMLKSFRDGRLLIASVDAIRDLGVREKAESTSIWSADHVGLVKLGKWFEEKGYETTGVW